MNEVTCKQNKTSSASVRSVGMSFFLIVISQHPAFGILQKNNNTEINNVCRKYRNICLANSVNAFDNDWKGLQFFVSSPLDYMEK